MQESPDFSGVTYLPPYFGAVGRLAGSFQRTGGIGALTISRSVWKYGNPHRTVHPLRAVPEPLFKTDTRDQNTTAWQSDFRKGRIGGHELIKCLEAPPQNRSDFPCCEVHGNSGRRKGIRRRCTHAGIDLAYTLKLSHRYGKLFS